MKRRAALAVAVMALVLGACGIPLSQSAHPVSSRGLNPVLSGAAASSTTTTPPKPQAATEHPKHLVVYLVDASGSHLVQVPRTWGQPVTPTIALNVLAIGPDSQDPRGLQTYLAAAPHAPVVVGKSGIAKVTLDESTFSELFGSSLYVPLAQIVFTLMANFSGIKGVDFFLAGQPPELFNYRPDGSVSADAVTEQTYASALKPETEQAYAASLRPRTPKNAKHKG